LYELDPDIVRPLDEGDPHAGAKVPGFHLDRDTAARSSATVASMSATSRPKWLVPKWAAASGEVLALPGAADQDLDAPEPQRTRRNTAES